jgi:hypothetical protein
MIMLCANEIRLSINSSRKWSGICYCSANNEDSKLNYIALKTKDLDSVVEVVNYIFELMLDFNVERIDEINEKESFLLVFDNTEFEPNPWFYDQFLNEIKEVANKHNFKVMELI